MFYENTNIEYKTKCMLKDAITNMDFVKWCYPHSLNKDIGNVLGYIMLLGIRF